MQSQFLFRNHLGESVYLPFDDTNVNQKCFCCKTLGTLKLNQEDRLVCTKTNNMQDFWYRCCGTECVKNNRWQFTLFNKEDPVSIHKLGAKTTCDFCRGEMLHITIADGETGDCVSKLTVPVTSLPWEILKHPKVIERYAFGEWALSNGDELFDPDLPISYGLSLESKHVFLIRETDSDEELQLPDSFFQDLMLQGTATVDLPRNRVQEFTDFVDGFSEVERKEFAKYLRDTFPPHWFILPPRSTRILLGKEQEIDDGTFNLILQWAPAPARKRSRSKETVICDRLPKNQKTMYELSQRCTKNIELQLEDCRNELARLAGNIILDDHPELTLYNQYMNN